MTVTRIFLQVLPVFPIDHGLAALGAIGFGLAIGGACFLACQSRLPWDGASKRPKLWRALQEALSPTLGERFVLCLDPEKVIVEAKDKLAIVRVDHFEST